MFTVDVYLAEQRESDAIGRTTKRLNLLFAPWLLAQELVAREAKHGKPIVPEIFLQCLQLLILRRETTF